MCDRNGGRRLRQWLIEQIDSSMYPGLIWENDEKTMFRIPWKHAGKQDYNQEVDASIFKAWAVFKGKFKEGDKAEPATWKTRLRCALNKSPDFEEVTDRSQLDISEPYKVYRIVPEEEQKCKLGVAPAGCMSEVPEMECGRSEIEELIKEPSVDEYMGMTKRSPSPPEACRSQILPDWWVQQPSAGLPLVTGYAAYDTHHSAFSQMVISFYYGGKLVGQATTTCLEGCRLSLSQPGLPKLYGPDGLEPVCFPTADTIPSERQRQVTRKLFGHLERGVLLHSNRKGVFVKRLCQGRVFCSGNAVVCKGRPNKLERDEVVQVFDTNQFIRELQQFYATQSRLPDSRVVLCFGEEFPDTVPLRSKLILVQVEQLYARQLVEEAGKSCGAGSLMPALEEPQPDQAFRMFPDICTSHQRPFFRENQQITVGSGATNFSLLKQAGDVEENPGPLESRMSQGPPAVSVLQRSVDAPGNQPQSPKDDDRKVRRREKNRVAAQRSRKKQTQKADKLHEEHESLEQENSVLRREISKLKEELRHLSEVLKEHEKMCPLLLCPMNFVQLRSDPVASCLPRGSGEGRGSLLTCGDVEENPGPSRASMKAFSPVRSVRKNSLSDHSLGISRSKTPVDDPMSLLYNMNDCYSKLKELVPSIPQNKKVTKMEILQHVIDYILDLQIALDSHPTIVSLHHQRPGQNQASRTPLTTLNTDISILSLQASEFPSELMSNDSKVLCGAS